MVEDLQKIFNLAMNAKALSHLKNGRKRVQATFDHKVLANINKQYILKELTTKLAELMFEDVKVQLKEEIDPNIIGLTTYNIEFMTFPTEMFQYIIKVIIKNLSPEDIEAIKRKQ